MTNTLTGKLYLKAYDKECIKIYNPNEKDLNKKLLKQLDRTTEAEKYLGITRRQVKYAMESKRRIYSPNLKMEVSIRLSNKNKKTNESFHTS